MLGKQYRHYKGNTYLVLGVSEYVQDDAEYRPIVLYAYNCDEPREIITIYEGFKHQSMDNELVLYMDVEKKDRIWARRKEIFLEVMENGHRRFQELK